MRQVRLFSGHTTNQAVANALSNNVNTWISEQKRTIGANFQVHNITHQMFMYGGATVHAVVTVEYNQLDPKCEHCPT